MGQFQTLTGGNPTKATPKITALSVELAQLEVEAVFALAAFAGIAQYTN